MTIREQARAALARVPSVTPGGPEALALRVELTALWRRLRGGHNSVGRRPSVCALRSELVNAAYDLRPLRVVPFTSWRRT